MYAGAGYGRSIMKYPNWVLCYGRDIVDRAFPAGISEDGEAVLVGRFIVEDALTPGKVKASMGKCFVPFGGEEKESEEYELLVETDDCSFDWLPSSGGQVPVGAVVGGFKADGNKIYIGRTYHEGKIIVGKVNVEQGCLYIADSGAEHRYDEYEILVCKSIDL